jgi:anti-sigma regulatory factor (Ser/Thr protein kinase)
MKAKRENKTAKEEVLVGHFSKKDAATRVADGCRHVHSSALGTKDPAYALTLQSLADNKDTTYPWELTRESNVLTIGTSNARHELIQRIVADTGVSTKRHLNEKLTSVLEELVTNSIFHAYRNHQGGEKYQRTKSATLSTSEMISVRYKANENGIYLSVTDQGGTLSFADVASSFRRCYGSDAQIQTKEGGAGLGMYMIFEYASHLKIISAPGKMCQVSCWLADKKAYDPHAFSFNFFQRR